MQSFFGALTQLFNDPGSNLVATTIGLAIVVLFIILILLIATAWVLLGGRDDENEDEPAEPVDEVQRAVIDEAAEARRARWTRVRLWAAGGLLVVGLLGVYAATSTNEYCGSTCHRMQPYEKSWETSSHRVVACVRCHEGTPGVTLVSGTLSRLRHAWADVEGAAVTGEPVDSERCLSCHGDLRTGVIVTKQGIRVKHQEIIEQGAPCEQCHASVGHMTPASGSRSVMSECLRCHDGKRASAECSSCHRGDVAKTPIVERQFSQIKLPAPTCGGCHDQKHCDACHGVRMPHPADFARPEKHAYLGSFGTRQDRCYRCHTFADCNRCHLTHFEGAHPGNWRVDHAKYPRSSGSTYCTGCHRRTKDLCVDCHPSFAEKD